MAPSGYGVCLPRAAALAMALAIGGCGSNSGGAKHGHGSSGGASVTDAGSDANGASGSSGLGGVGGAVVTGSGNAGGVIFTGTGGASGTGGDGGFQICDAVTLGVESVQLDMYVIQDHTASMGEDPTTGQTVTTGPGAPDCPVDPSQPPQVADKWCFATNALAEYFTSQGSKGNRAALQFMTTMNDDCAGGADNSEATPVVPLTLLPVALTDPLITALANDTPAGGLGTHIESALHGIADFTAANVTPGRIMIGVLITDGDPNGCSGDIDALAAIAADHLTQTGIKTFIIGMTGSTPANLETLAVAGGGPSHGPDFCADGDATCHYWSVGDGDGAAIANALRQIQLATVIPCEYQIPTLSPGELFDPKLVNLRFTSGDGGISPVEGVPSSSDCGTAGGWFYDDPTRPSKIELCPSSCTLVESAQGTAHVDIAYGCETNTMIQ